MSSDHPGFAYWKGTDPAYPIGPIELRSAGPDHAVAFARIAIPQAQPTPMTVAVRSIGIAHSAQLWFALECTTDAQGALRCEAVLRGRHVHAFAEHGETGSGPTQEVRVAPADLRQGGFVQRIAAHGAHCDTFSADWWLDQGGIGCQLSVYHWGKSVRQFLADREKAEDESEEIIILEPLEPNSDWKPQPGPEVPVAPEIGPDGS